MKFTLNVMPETMWMLESYNMITTAELWEMAKGDDTRRTIRLRVYFEGYFCPVVEIVREWNSAARVYFYRVEVEK